MGRFDTPWCLRLRRAAASLAIAAYVATTGVFVYRHAVGDSAGTPLSYAFTWDMFPWHDTESFKRLAVGQTASGRYLQIVPCGLQQFRGGARSDLTRVDLDRRGGYFRPTVEQTLQLTAAGAGDDPVTHVWLIEEYWPAKFNLPPEVYAEWAGAPRPERRYWRVRSEFDWPHGKTAAAVSESSP